MPRDPKEEMDAEEQLCHYDCNSKPAYLIINTVSFRCRHNYSLELSLLPNKKDVNTKQLEEHPLMLRRHRGAHRNPEFSHIIITCTL